MCFFGEGDVVVFREEEVLFFEEKVFLERERRRGCCFFFGEGEGVFFVCFFLGGRVFPDSAISPPILMSCSSHTEACNALGTTDGVTSHC